jgi:hypothetical protein
MVSSHEVHLDLRTSDLYRLMFFDSVRKLIYARRMVALAIVVLIALGAQYPAVLGPLFLPSFKYLLVAGLIFVAVALPYLRSRTIVRTAMGTSSTVTCAVGPLGVEVRRQGSQKRYDWAKVRNAKQASGLVLIYLDGHSTIIIPKRCFASSQQFDDFRAIVAAHVKSKPKSPDRLN